MPAFSVKKPLTVFVAVLAIIVLGVVAYIKMTPDLLPNMDFPYAIIVTAYPGASPESVEQEVTGPVEQSMATLEHIKEVTSTSSNSVSMVVLEFEEGVNMDTVAVDIQQKLSALSGQWSDTVATPYVMKINPSMLPVMVTAISYDGKDVHQVSDFVDETLAQKLTGVTGVASVDINGTVDRQLHVILDPEKLDCSFTAFCYIKMKQHTYENADRLMKAVQTMDEVGECYNISGDYDFLLKVYVSSMKEYQQFVFEQRSLVDLSQDYGSRSYSNEQQQPHLHCFLNDAVLPLREDNMSSMLHQLFLHLV